jgi:hypothetical protein
MARLADVAGAVRSPQAEPVAVGAIKQKPPFRSSNAT